MNGHGVTVGCGTLYEVRRVGHDRWSESVLHNFGVGQDQETNPSCVLLRGMDGTLYGTIQYPPDIFAFKADNERVLYTFLINTSLLGDPSSGVISDAGGRLYGTTAGIGTVYRLTPPGKAERSWSATLLATFPPGYDSPQPYGGVVAGNDGALYGAAAAGYQSKDAGYIFRLSP